MPAPGDTGDADRFNPAQVAALVARLRAATRGLPSLQRQAVWHKTINRFPREVALVRAYVAELILTEGWDELDAFEARASTLRSEDIDLLYVDAAIATAEVGKTRDRLTRVLSTYGESIASTSRAFELALISKDFTAAAKAAKRLDRGAGPVRTKAATMKAMARFYGDAQRAWAVKDNRPRDYDILIVNLDRDVSRMERTARQVGEGSYTRVPAVRGSYLPDQTIAEMTRRAPPQMKATAGCFLSHISAWELIVRNDRPALILEDDAWIFASLPPRIELLPLPADYEVCFVNDGMVPSRKGPFPSKFRVTKAADAALRKPAEWSAPGTLGYIVSPAGARELLRRTARDGIAGDVDWRLVVYAMTQAELRELVTRRVAASGSVAFHRACAGKRRPLRAYSLVPALVRHIEGGSVRVFGEDGITPELGARIDRVATRRLERHRGRHRQ